MPTYFPYSYVIGKLCKNCRSSVSKHPYVGDWSVCDGNAARELKPCRVEISEIYY